MTTTADPYVVADPICDHILDSVGQVSSHAAISAAIDQPHASTTVCSRPECIDDAYRWVLETVGVPGRFYARNRDGWCQDGVQGARYARIPPGDSPDEEGSSKYLLEEHPEGEYALRWHGEGDLEAIWLRPGQRIGAAVHGQPLYSGHDCPECA